MRRFQQASLITLNSSKSSTKQFDSQFFRQRSLKRSDNKWLKYIVLPLYLLASFLFNIFHIISEVNHYYKLAWISFAISAAASIGIVTFGIFEAKVPGINTSSHKRYIFLTCFMLCFAIFKMILYDICYSSHQYELICVLELIFIYTWAKKYLKYRWQMIPLCIALMLYGIISNSLQSTRSPRIIIHQIIAAILLIFLELTQQEALASQERSESQKTCEMLLNHLPDLITVVSDTKEVIFANKAYQHLAEELDQSSQNLDLFSRITELRFKEEKGLLIELLKVESQPSDSKTNLMDAQDENTMMKLPLKEIEVSNWRINNHALDLKMEIETPLPKIPKRSKPKTLVLRCDLGKAIMTIVQNFQQFQESIGEGLSILYGKLHKENGVESTYEIKLSCPRIMNKTVLLVSLSETAHKDKVLKLEEISRFKSGLLGAFSHELRTPLNANLNFLTAASENIQIPGDLREKLITPALKNAELLMYLVYDILDFSQMSTNTLTLNFSKQNLEELINELVFMFKIQSKQKKVKVKFEIDKEVPKEIRTDFQRLKQILVNLIRYAINHTFDGTILIKVSSFEQLPRVYRFLLQDSGKSLSEEEQAKLFEFLYDGPNKDGYEDVPTESVGLTLGLKIASKLSELLCPAKKGGLRYQSTQYAGTNFYFYVEDLMGETEYLDIDYSITDYLKKSAFKTDLKESAFKTNLRVPFAESPRKGSNFNETMPAEISCVDPVEVNAILVSNYKTNHKPTNPSQFETNKNLLKKEQLESVTQRMPIAILPEDPKVTLGQNVCGCSEALIVDDDAFNILSLGALLHKAEVNYEEAYNGQLAIDKILAKRRCCQDCHLYSIIFMDCNMPVKDGYEATAELKELMHKKIIPIMPIVACTAYVIDYQATHCKDVGMDEYLTKPVNQKMLLDILKKWGIM